jgi:tagatose-1,6-bisphosphate aldolase
VSEKANKLHDKRIERIEEIYSLLTDFHSEMQNLISWKVVTGMSKEDIEKQEFDRIQKAGDTGNKFLNYYAKNKLYFNQETCSLIDEIIDLLRTSHLDLSHKYVFGRMPAQLEFENVRNASQSIRDKVPEVKEKLEANFRQIIGVI